jgi:hypothetical protein
MFQKVVSSTNEEMIDAIFQWMTSLGCIDTSKAPVPKRRLEMVDVPHLF